MKILCFDLGLENTAHVHLGAYNKPRIIGVVSRGTITTEREDELQHRVQLLAAMIGQAIHDAKKERLDLVVAEAPPLGSSAGGWSQRSNATTFGVRCVLEAACLYAGVEVKFYAARTWQAALEVPDPPKELGEHKRRLWKKERVAERVALYVANPDVLRNAHERDAAGVGVCHILKQWGGVLDG